MQIKVVSKPTSREPSKVPLKAGKKAVSLMVNPIASNPISKVSRINRASRLVSNRDSQAANSNRDRDSQAANSRRDSQAANSRRDSQAASSRRDSQVLSSNEDKNLPAHLMNLIAPWPNKHAKHNGNLMPNRQPTNKGSSKLANRSKDNRLQMNNRLANKTVRHLGNSRQPVKRHPR